jgi:cobalamin biosynthesis protein CobT
MLEVAADEKSRAEEKAGTDGSSGVRPNFYNNSNDEDLQESEDTGCEESKDGESSEESMDSDSREEGENMMENAKEHELKNEIENSVGSWRFRDCCVQRRKASCAGHRSKTTLATPM